MDKGESDQADDERVSIVERVPRSNDEKGRSISPRDLADIPSKATQHTDLDTSRNIGLLVEALNKMITFCAKQCWKETVLSSQFH